MTKGEDSHSEIARVRQSDGIKVIFDRSSAAISRSRSRSRSAGRRATVSGRHRGRSSRRHHRCSSSSSSSRSSSRSRSHPRCHRPSSRCRCDNHRRRGRRSAPRRHKEGSDSPSPSRHSRHRRNRSRSSRSGRAVSRFSQSPPRNHRSSSGSGCSENSVDLSIDGKGKPMSAKAAIIQEDEKLYSPEIVDSIQSAQAVESKQVLRETWVRQDLEKTPSQSDEGELDDMFSLGMSLKRRTISFSINNSVLKPTAAAAASGAKVTSRMDSYESRKPYGHWMPVKSGHTSRARKHAPSH